MIRSFRAKDTEKIWLGEPIKKFSIPLQEQARRKLRMLNNAMSLEDLRIPPANRLEALKGDRTGQHSIRINRQWRVCFRWEDGHCFDVEIVDYH